MTNLGNYILSIGAAGILCALAEVLCSGSGSTGKTWKLVAGLFLLVTVLKPLVQIPIRDLQDDWDFYAQQAQDAVAQGENQTALALQNSIKEGIASYILSKGADLGVQLTVQVVLQDAAVPNVSGLLLQGDVSPYAKQTLTETLCRELALEEEDILWQ